MAGELKENSSNIGFIAATKQALLGTVGGWHLYWTQAVLPAAFALALLYLTVLSLGASLSAAACCLCREAFFVRSKPSRG